MIQFTPASWLLLGNYVTLYHQYILKIRWHHTKLKENENVRREIKKRITHKYPYSIQEYFSPRKACVLHCLAVPISLFSRNVTAVVTLFFKSAKQITEKKLFHLTGKSQVGSLSDKGHQDSAKKALNMLLHSSMSWLKKKKMKKLSQQLFYITLSSTMMKCHFIWKMKYLVWI